MWHLVAIKNYRRFPPLTFRLWCFAPGLDVSLPTRFAPGMFHPQDVLPTKNCWRQRKRTNGKDYVVFAILSSSLLVHLLHPFVFSGQNIQAGGEAPRGETSWLRNVFGAKRPGYGQNVLILPLTPFQLHAILAGFTVSKLLSLNCLIVYWIVSVTGLWLCIREQRRIYHQSMSCEVLQLVVATAYLLKFHWLQWLCCLEWLSYYKAVRPSGKWK